MKRPSQKRKILDYLLAGGSLSQAEAIRLFRCYRLSGRILDLRKEGHNIRTSAEVTRGEDGEYICYARYSMAE